MISRPLEIMAKKKKFLLFFVVYSRLEWFDIILHCIIVNVLTTFLPARLPPSFMDEQFFLQIENVYFLSLKIDYFTCNPNGSDQNSPFYCVKTKFSVVFLSSRQLPLEQFDLQCCAWLLSNWLGVTIFFALKKFEQGVFSDWLFLLFFPIYLFHMKLVFAANLYSCYGRLLLSLAFEFRMTNFLQLLLTLFYPCALI